MQHLSFQTSRSKAMPVHPACRSAAQGALHPRHRRALLNGSPRVQPHRPGGGHAGRRSPWGEGPPNVSRSGQRNRLPFDARGIWSKLLIAAYECAVAYSYWCARSETRHQPRAPMLPPHQARKERVMALSSTLVVHVDKPAEILLSTYFTEMRIWLNAHEIAPTDFRLFDLEKIKKGEPEAKKLRSGTSQCV